VETGFRRASAASSRTLTRIQRSPAGGARARERVAALELLAVQLDHGVAVGEGALDRDLAAVALGQVAVGADVPDDDRAGPVALADPALEAGVVHRVVLDRHCQPLVTRVRRRSLRHRPRAQHAADLDPEVVVQRARLVLMDHEQGIIGMVGGA
jgi:hypothetical protein